MKKEKNEMNIENVNRYRGLVARVTKTTLSSRQRVNNRWLSPKLETEGQHETCRIKQRKQMRDKVNAA